MQMFLKSKLPLLEFIFWIGFLLFLIYFFSKSISTETQSDLNNRALLMLPLPLFRLFMIIRNYFK